MQFVNTEEFRHSAKTFLKNGFYTSATPGSHPWREYWTEELRRCREGYEVGGVKITGHHYGYLNYAQIMLTEDTGGKKKGAKKTRAFPAFWDGDYNYFWSVEIARNGMEKPEYQKLGLLYQIPDRHLDGGRHIIVMKARRKGYSFKSGWIVANTYNTERNSLSIIGASEKRFLYPEGTMGMTTNYLNFLNEHTPWYKRRGVIDKVDHKKASFKLKENGVEVEKGYMSQVMAISFKDNPDAGRGKDSQLILFEEAGKFPGLKAAYMATRPTVEDGSYVTGQILVFGTGGGDDSNWRDFEEMFYSPDEFNFLSVDNQWDDGGSGTQCGLFVPDYLNKVGKDGSSTGFIDQHGNSLIDIAKRYEAAKREGLKAAGASAGNLDRHIAEYPFTPAEGFLRIGSNVFPTRELQQHLNDLKTRKATLHGAVTGRMSAGKFHPSDEIPPVFKFPHTRDDDTRGCVVLWDAPKRIEGKVPAGLYYICHDPYAHDQTTGTSLGAAYVKMRVTKRYSPDDYIVAGYVGRPATQDDYNEQLFQLAEYYNCRIGFENDRGDVIGYAKRTRQLHLLETEFEFDFHKDLKSTTVNRGYGMHLGSGKNSPRKNQGILYLNQWLRTKRGKNADGSYILNLHTIRDPALLEELIKFDPENGNFDRVSALLVGAFYEHELIYRDVEVEQEEQVEQDFFSRDHFV